MQITVDLPEDVIAKAAALAKEGSGNISAVIVSALRKLQVSPSRPLPEPPAGHGCRFPVVEGRPVTESELAQLLEADGLP